MPKSKFLQKILNTITGLLVFFFLAGGTIFAIYYGKGYRFNLQENTVEKTGVLSITSNPTRALLSIDGEEKGLTPKTVGSLKEGSYTVTVEKEGYHYWQKQLPIKAELSTPYIANLYLKEPTRSVSFEIGKEHEILGSYLSDNQNQFFIVAREILENQNQDSNTNSSTAQVIQSPQTLIYAFTINENFLNFAENPEIIFRDTIPDNQSIEINPSRNGELVALYLKEEGEIIGSYLIDINNIENIENRELSTLPKLNLELFHENYDISWTNTNNYMLISSQEEIFSFNSINNATILMHKGQEMLKDLTYYVDPGGNMYYLKKITQESETGNEDQNEITTNTVETENQEYYQLIQKSLNGTSEEVFIDHIFYSKDPERVQTLKNLSYIQKDVFQFNAKNSKNYLVGEITSFAVHPEGAGVFLTTDQASYWYNIDTNKYYLVELGPTEFVKFSPDLKNFIYIQHLSKTHEESGDNSQAKNDKSAANKTQRIVLKVFTFEKDSIDHLTKIGTKEIKTMSSSNSFFTSGQNYQWLSNSSNLSFLQYSDVNTLGINHIDIDGENSKEIIGIDLYSIPSDDPADFIYTFDYQSQYIFTIEKVLFEETAQEVAEDTQSDENPESDNANKTNLDTTNAPKPIENASPKEGIQIVQYKIQ